MDKTDFSSTLSARAAQVFLDNTNLSQQQKNLLHQFLYSGSTKCLTTMVDFSTISATRFFQVGTQPFSGCPEYQFHNHYKKIKTLQDKTSMILLDTLDGINVLTNFSKIMA